MKAADFLGTTLKEIVATREERYGEMMREAAQKANMSLDRSEFMARQMEAIDTIRDVVRSIDWREFEFAHQIYLDSETSRIWTIPSDSESGNVYAKRFWLVKVSPLFAIVEDDSVTLVYASRHGYILMSHLTPSYYHDFDGNDLYPAAERLLLDEEFDSYEGAVNVRNLISILEELKRLVPSK